MYEIFIVDERAVNSYLGSRPTHGLGDKRGMTREELSRVPDGVTLALLNLEQARMIHDVPELDLAEIVFSDDFAVLTPLTREEIIRMMVLRGHPIVRWPGSGNPSFHQVEKPGPDRFAPLQSVETDLPRG